MVPRRESSKSKASVVTSQTGYPDHDTKFRLVTVLLALGLLVREAQFPKKFRIAPLTTGECLPLFVPHFMTCIGFYLTLFIGLQSMKA